MLWTQVLLIARGLDGRIGDGGGVSCATRGKGIQDEDRIMVFYPTCPVARFVVLVFHAFSFDRGGGCQSYKGGGRPVLLPVGGCLQLTPFFCHEGHEMITFFDFVDEDVVKMSADYFWTAPRKRTPGDNHHKILAAS